jgi:hypothetical protein
MVTKQISDTSINTMQLTRQIDVAERNLLIQRRHQKEAPASDATDPGMGVIFTGNFSHSIPHNLLFDPVLNPADKTLWMIIRANIINPQAPGYVPSRDELAIAMGCAAPTVSRARATLRIGRWMTFLRTVRDDQKRFVGDIYLLHDEPLSLADTLALDEGYIRFLEDQARGSSKSKSNRQLAASMLSDIDRLKSTPVSPTQREMMEQRFTVASKLPSTEPRNSLSFVLGEDGLLEDIGPSRRKNFAPAFQSFQAESTEETPISDGHSKNFAPDRPTRSKIFSLGQNRPEKNFALDSSSGSSSYFNNKYISTRAREADRNPADQDAFATAITWRPCKPQSGGAYCNAISLVFWLLLNPGHRSTSGVFISLTFPLLLGKFCVYPEMDSAMSPTNCLAVWLPVQHGKTDPIQNLVGFTHSLITRYETGNFALDEWGVQGARGH